MQKQIFEFPTVNVPLPTDLFLISHAGMTANMALDTVANYSNNLLRPQLNTLNTNIRSLSALTLLDADTLTAKLTSLSGNINTLNSEYLFLSAFFNSFPSTVNLLSSETFELSSNFLNFANSTLNNFTFLNSWSATVTSHLLNIDSNIFVINSQISELSSNLTIDEGTLTQLSTRVDEISSNFDLYASETSIELNALSNELSNLLSATDILSATTNELVTAVHVLSSDFFTLSSLTDVLFLSSVDLNTRILSLSSSEDSFLLNINSLSSNVLELSSNVLELSSGTLFLSGWINSIDFTSATNPTIQNLQTEINGVSAYADRLSAYVDSIDFSSATNPLLVKIQSNILTVSATADSLTLSAIDLYSFRDTLSSSVVALSTFNLTDILSLSSKVLNNYNILNSSITSLSSEFKTNLLNFNHTLSTEISDLSALYLNLSGLQDDLKLTVDILSSTGIADSFIEFGLDALSGRDTLTISASSEVIIQTNQIYNWVFNASGGLVLPGNLMYTTGPSSGHPYTSPIELDLSTTVQKINSGFYHLKNGYEGQIMYFVPRPNSLGDVYAEIRIDNVRYWTTDKNSLIRTAAQGSMYWIPWMLRSHLLEGPNYALDASYDLFPTVATAIFTDGAWNLSTGRYG